MPCALSYACKARPVCAAPIGEQRDTQNVVASTFYSLMQRRSQISSKPAGAWLCQTWPTQHQLTGKHVVPAGYPVSHPKQDTSINAEGVGQHDA